MCLYNYLRIDNVFTIYLFIQLFIYYLLSNWAQYDRFHLSLGRHGAIKFTRAEFLT